MISALRFMWKLRKVIAIGAALAAIAWLAFEFQARGDQIVTLKHELQACEERAEAWRSTARQQSTKALEAHERRQAVERRLAELLAQPPKVVMRYIRAEPEVREVIRTVERDGGTCADAVLALGDFLKAAPRFGDDP